MLETIKLFHYSLQIAPDKVSNDQCIILIAVSQPCTFFSPIMIIPQCWTNKTFFLEFIIIDQEPYFFYFVLSLWVGFLIIEIGSEQYYINSQTTTMIKTLSVFVALLAISFAFQIQTSQVAERKEVTAIPWPFTICGEGDWTIESLTLDQTPKRNTNDNIIATGTAKKSTNFKRADVLVKLNGAFLDKQNADFSNSFDEGDTIEFLYTNFIPSFAPFGTYTIQFQFLDNSDKKNGCLSFQFKL